MIEMRFRLHESETREIYFKMKTENIDGPCTKLESEFAEKLCLSVRESVIKINEEMGFPPLVDTIPFQITRRDK